MKMIDGTATVRKRQVDIKMVMIMAEVTTKDAHKRMQQMARDHGYQLEEWLAFAEHGGMKVVAAIKVDGVRQARGFKWDGQSINELAVRCMALDVTMQGLPEFVRSMKKIRREAN